MHFCIGRCCIVADIYIFSTKHQLLTNKEVENNCARLSLSLCLSLVCGSLAGQDRRLVTVTSKSGDRAGLLGECQDLATNSTFPPGKLPPPKAGPGHSPDILPLSTIASFFDIKPHQNVMDYNQDGPRMPIF